MPRIRFVRQNFSSACQVAECVDRAEPPFLGRRRGFVRAVSEVIVDCLRRGVASAPGLGSFAQFLVLGSFAQFLPRVRSRSFCSWVSSPRSFWSSEFVRAQFLVSGFVRAVLVSGSLRNLWISGSFAQFWSRVRTRNMRISGSFAQFLISGSFAAIFAPTPYISPPRSCVHYILAL